MKHLHKIAPHLLLLTVSVFSAVFFNGCVTPQEKTESNTIALEFWTLQLMDFKDVLEPMFASYENAHPGITIKWVDVPFNQGEKRALTAMLSPSVPDVINLNPAFSARLASRGALLDLSTVTPEAVKQAYLPVAIDAASIQLPATQQQPQHTEWFGYPWYLTTSISLANPTLLQGAGQPLPASVQQLSTFCTALKQHTNQTCTMPTFSNGEYFLKLLAANGQPWFDASNRQVHLNTPEALALLTTYVDMFTQGQIPPEALTESARAALDRFQSGKLALMNAGSSYLNVIKENAPSLYDTLEIHPQFPADTKMVDFALMVLIVPKKSKHPKEAADFAAFMTNNVNQLAFAKAAPVLPSTLTALDDPYFTQSCSKPNTEDTTVCDPQKARATQLSIQQLKQATQAWQVHPMQAEINERMAYFVQNALLGKLTPQQALTQAQTEIQALVK